MSLTESSIPPVATPTPKRKLLSVISFVAILAVGLFLRTYKLDKPIMWCDEAESSINALTILQHGVPKESYLGLPIYENTLTDPWPGHPEYEFRDSSYSDKGLAIYHGWLPLYGIAGSFKLFGIQPDTDTTTLKPKHDAAAISKRTIAARLPAVVASVAFLILLFIAASEMYGRDAGWAALLTASVAVPMVNIARQARYYSLTAALSAACCLAGWRLYKRGLWRDYLFAAVAFSMLFHTHVLTFAIACASVATLLPFMFRHPQAIRKMLVCGAIIASCTIPWMFATGFIGSAQSVPKAISTMILPDDLIAWPKKYWQISLVMVAGMMLTVLLHLVPGLFPERVRTAYVAHRPAFYFLGAWILIGFSMFMLLIPAASLFFQRLYLGAVGPGIIFGAMLFAGFGRAIGRRVGVPVAVATFVVFVCLNTRAGYWWQRNVVQKERLAYLVNDMRSWELNPGTRLYSTPTTI